MTQTESTEPSAYNAFDSAQPVKVRLSDTHHITPEATVADGRLIISLELEEIAQSRPKGRDAQLGFWFDPVRFQVNGRLYQISPGWTVLTRVA
jgi:hypothetical protein